MSIPSYDDTVIVLTAAVLNAHGVSHIVHPGGLNVSRPGKSIRIGDIASLIADFESLATRPDLVAQALAAHALDQIGRQHSIPSTGLTIAIKTAKSTLASPSSWPMNMLRGR